MRKELELFEKEFKKLEIVDKKLDKYYKARDLMKFLGYKKWDSFERVIIKAIDLCNSNGKDINEYFVPIMSFESLYKLIYNYEAVDYKINEMACYLIFMVANDKYENVRLGKEYIEYKKIILE